MKELEILLDNYWIIKDNDKDLFYKIKDSIPEFKNFITEKLGYSILMNQHVIKLQKIPGSSQSFMGIQEFNDTTEYILLCLLLMFLEDKSRDDQFVLSEITEFIEGNYIGREKLDWTQFRIRKHFIKVLKFAQNVGIMKVDDGDDQKFAYDENTEVLYESTGLSRYFVRHFTWDIMQATNSKDMENAEWGNLNTDRGVIRRQRVYRRLIMEPVVYSQGFDDADYDYIKKQRGLIENDLQKYLQYNLHVHRNAAMVVVPGDKNLKDTFPNTKAISDITLLFNSWICSALKKEELKATTTGNIIVSRAYFNNLVSELKNYMGSGWSKEYREMNSTQLANNIIDYMESFNMVRIINGGREIEILSLTGKLTGQYPKDFAREADKEKENAG